MRPINLAMAVRRLTAQRFRLGGKTTRRTPLITQTASRLKGRTPTETIHNTLGFVSRIPRMREETAARNRTADEILKRNRMKGCNCFCNAYQGPRNADKDC